MVCFFVCREIEKRGRRRTRAETRDVNGGGGEAFWVLIFGHWDPGMRIAGGGVDLKRSGLTAAQNNSSNKWFKECRDFMYVGVWISCKGPIAGLNQPG